MRAWLRRVMAMGLGAAALASAQAARAEDTRRDGSDAAREGRDPAPMGWTSVGVKLGLAGMSEARLTVERTSGTHRGRVGRRHGLHLALPIDLGGSAFGWTLEPYLSRSTVSDALGDGAARTRQGVAALTAVGLYTGPHYNFQLLDPLYLGVGVGLRAGYVASSALGGGADAYLRMPLSASFYLHDQVAMIAEVGLGYGASVLTQREARTSVDPRTGDSETDETPLFGAAFAWDCSIGVRIP